MSFHYLLDEFAQKEYDVAVEWYLQKSLKAASNFVLEVENTIQLICDNPKRWRNEYKHFRELGLKKFPYVIIYVIEEITELVIITAIFDTRKSPKNKYRKI